MALSNNKDQNLHLLCPFQSLSSCNTFCLFEIQFVLKLMTFCFESIFQQIYCEKYKIKWNYNVHLYYDVGRTSEVSGGKPIKEN